MMDLNTARRQVALAVEGFLVAGGLVRGLTGSQVYAPTDTAVYRKFTQPTPDRAVTITVYDMETVGERPGGQIRVALVQVKTRAGRADPLEVDDLADSIVHLLEGVHHSVWGGIKVEAVTHTFGGGIGADSSGRQERSDNFRIVLQTEGA